MDEQSVSPRRGLILIWPILILKIIAFVTTIYSIFIMVTGQFSLPMGSPVAMVDFFDAFGWIDHTTNFIVASSGLAGALALIFRKKVALPLFIGGFVLGVFLGIYQMTFNNFFEALGMRGVVGWILGTLVVLAIVFYTRMLVKRDLLT